MNAANHVQRRLRKMTALLEFQQWYFKKRDSYVQEHKGDITPFDEGYLIGLDECYQKINRLLEDCDENGN